MARIQTQHSGVVFDLVLFSKLRILIYDYAEASSDVVCRAYRCLYRFLFKVKFSDFCYCHLV